VLAPGSRLDRYVIDSLLGEGGMGAVYRALDERLGRRVALKVVRADAGRGSEGSTNATARLVREARAAAALSHPGIVAVYDVGEHDGTPYIAMELVAGRPLRSFVGDASVGVGTRTRWLLEVARALGAAHRAGLVHRDVKPDNVLVRDDGRVVVLDFGIARPVRGAIDPSAPTQSPALATLTAEGVAVGTPAYMAPEQIRGEPVDGRTDQFAWAVVAHELLTGRAPWRSAGDALALAASILTDEPAPLEVAGLDATFADAVRRALAKDPGARFASMEELVAAADPDAGEVDEAPPRAPSGLSSVARTETPVAGATADAPRPSSRRLALVGGLIAALGLGALAATRLAAPPASPAAPTASASVATPSSAAPLPMLAVPPPVHAKPEALALYAEARKKQHEASWTAAHNLLEQAVAKDADFAEARFQLSLAQAQVAAVVLPEARASYRRALELRDRMSARDRELCLAFEPLFGRDPADGLATVDRLEELSRARPGDAEVHVLASIAGSQLGRPDVVAPHAERAAAIDPDYGDAWQLVAHARAASGRFAEAEEAVEHCRRVAPGTADCVVEALAFHEFLGRCDAAERDAKAIVDLSSRYGPGHGARPWFFLAAGKPREAVRLAFEEGWRAMGPELRFVEAYERPMWALAEGDFDAAEQLARDGWKKAADDRTEGVHAAFALAIALAAIESGRPERALAAIDDYRARRDLLTSMGNALADPALAFVATRRDAGRATAREIEEERERFRKRWSASLAGTPTLAFAVIDGQGVATRAEAEAALARAPSPLAPHELLVLPTSAAWIGKLFELTGDDARALEWDSIVTRMCGRLRTPLLALPTHLRVGEIHARRGEKDLACKELGFVLDRWGRAKPRSVTAERARAAAKKAGCPDR
jgi:serine/threonine-protein kinase